jgi:5-methyltetrahydropteroyltriglutamate--homocysteine methyltransferase
MKRSTERILTTHTGSLPRTTKVLDLLERTIAGDAVDPEAFGAAVREGVNDVVSKQTAAGLDVVNDGEMSKFSFANYNMARLSGFSAVPAPAGAPAPTGHLMGIEASEYPEFFERWAFNAGAAASQGATQEAPVATMVLTCTGPITYTGTDALQRDIDNLLAAAEVAGATEPFMSAVPSTGIASATGGTPNQYYGSDEEFDTAMADAMRVEYERIVDAGIVLQLDCNWGVLYRVAMDNVEDVRRWIAHSIDVMNYATRNIDADMMRIHLCWGADEAPHHRDLPLDAIIDLMLTARPHGLGVVASNGRHEWEWRVWEDVEVPEGKVIVPGVIDSTTNIIEHPETVAERILRFANVLGRENVIGGVDCGLDTIAGSAQVVPRIAWKKLEALAEGARLATERLY